MYHMIMDSQALTPDEFKYVTKSVGLPEVRIQIADLFSAFATPRKIIEDKCFYNLGAICRAILEIYKVNCSDELKELHSLMVIGQMIFIIHNGRKLYLNTELDVHPIWQDTEIWKVCLQRVINLKFQDGVLNLEKQKSEQEAKERKERETGFKGFLSKVKSIADKPEPQ